MNEKHGLEWNLQTERVQTTLTEEERGKNQEEGDKTPKQLLGNVALKYLMRRNE